MTLSVLTTFQQWVLFIGVALAVGCVAWRFVVMRRAVSLLDDGALGALRAAEGRVARIAMLSIPILVFAWLLRLTVQVMGFRDPFVPLREDVSFLLFEMFWGTVWMGQGVVIVLLAGAFWMARGASPSAEERGSGVAAMASDPRNPSVGWLLAAPLVLALVLTLALSSHAMGVEAGRPFFVAADALHTLGAGSWIGVLAVILFVAGRVGHDGPGGLFAAQIRAFSPLALLSGGGLVLMGSALAWTHVQSPANLFGTSYGRILLAKIALAGVVFAAGFVNWRRGVPSLDSETGALAVRRRGAWEVVAATGVLLLTAILVHAAKP